MGLDLELKVQIYGDDFGSTVDLDLDRNYDLFQMFTETFRRETKPSFSPRPIEPGKFVYLYMDDGLKRIRMDAYGTELTYLTAEEFKRIPSTVKETLSPLNRAALAYIGELPDDTKIYLYWC